MSLRAVFLLLAFSAVTAVVARRCGTRDPDLIHREHLKDVIGKLPERRSDSFPPLTLKLAFHVITSGSTGRLSQAALDAQVAVMNKAFEGTASTIPTQVRFTLAATDYTDNPTWFTSCASASMEKTIKNALARDPTQFVNVYFCAPADDTLGWAYFPDDYPETSKLHGIFILHTALPGGTPPYDLGMTLVHEMGHYLGLLHTFSESGTDCTEAGGDLIADTPLEKSSASGCNLARDTCPSAAGTDPVWNYMDYSDDGCFTHFTRGQVVRMRDMLQQFRPALVANSGGPASSTVATNPTETSTTGKPNTTTATTKAIGTSTTTRPPATSSTTRTTLKPSTTTVTTRTTPKPSTTTVTTRTTPKPSTTTVTTRTTPKPSTTTVTTRTTPKPSTAPPTTRTTPKPSTTPPTTRTTPTTPPTTRTTPKPSTAPPTTRTTPKPSTAPPTTRTTSTTKLSTTSTTTRAPAVRSIRTCAQLGWPVRAPLRTCSQGINPCSRTVTYTDALNICRSLGARLCTELELTGSAFPACATASTTQTFWSSTKCGAGFVVVQSQEDDDDAYDDDDQVISTTCRSGAQRAQARCCADP